MLCYEILGFIGSAVFGLCLGFVISVFIVIIADHYEINKAFALWSVDVVLILSAMLRVLYCKYQVVLANAVVDQALQAPQIIQIIQVELASKAKNPSCPR